MAKALLILELDDDEGFVYREIEMPISPFIGMMLMLGEGAAWRQLVIDNVMLNFANDEHPVECWVSFCGGMYDRKWMEEDGWSSSR